MEALLRGISGYYVYVLCRPDATPFYIGKGIKRRVLEHELEARRHHPLGETNPIKCNVIRKILRSGGEIGYQIDSVFDVTAEQACLEREAELIGRYRRIHEGGILTNLAGGLGNAAGAAPLSLAKHAATLSGEPENNVERATLNRFLTSIGPVSSVPIKPVSQLGRVLPTLPHPKPRQPTARAAYALTASAVASGITLAPETAIPRSFCYRGIEAIIENGVSRDLMQAGMADLVTARDPRYEKFAVSEPQIDTLVGLVGQSTIDALGLL